MWSQLRSAVTGALLALISATAMAAQAPTTVASSPAIAAATSSPAAPGVVMAPHDLSKSDVDAWLDGFIPYALDRNDIPGAVVVVVKNGQVLTQRGFGYADVAARRPVDPTTTLFRPGSISKLFTWTAVMQLVEQGRIDLDADVNRYIDFKIPPYQGRPVTMRDLMTHTPGFGDVFKGGDRASGDVPPLGAVVKTLLPDRIYAPGSTPAYSNYGTALAGYVVERVSGVPFNLYVERKIFQPLGMAHSTFGQPLPASLAPLMAKGYEVGSGPAKPFELISVPPAGGASVSGADMAKFMIAHLNDGAGLMRPQTAAQLHQPSRVVLPGLNRMALGFYEQQVNGLSAIGHGGDLKYFHSYLWLIPSQNVGIFVSLNGEGADSGSFALRLALFQAFGDRYYPASTSAPVELSTAKAHAEMLAGHYSASRGAFTNFIDISNFLGQTTISRDDEGRPIVPNEFGGPPGKWIEVAPFLWRDAYGTQRLSAKVENGKVVRWSIDAVSPFMVWDRTPWYRDTTWLMPAVLLGAGVVLITALAWPIGAIARRRYAAPLKLTGPHLLAHRLLHGLAWLVIGVLAGWFLLLKALPATDANLDGWIWLLEVGGAVGFVAFAGCTLWMAGRTLTRPSSWLARAWAVVRAIGAAAILWMALAFHLVSFGASY